MSYVEDKSEDEQNMSRCLYERDYEYEVEEGDKEGAFTIDEMPNRLENGELKAHRFQYQIPNSIKMRFPRRGEKPSQPPEAKVVVHPRLVNFIQACNLAIREPERSRLGIGSQREMVENSFISAVETTLLQYETHQELLNELDSKKLSIVDLQRKQAEEHEAFEVEKKKIQDALTQAQNELQVKDKEVQRLKVQVAELSSTILDYAHYVENAETKGFNRCLNFVEKVYKNSLNLSLMYDAIKNNELDELSDDEEEKAHMEVNESAASS